MRCAIINSQTDVVENVIELAQGNLWKCPAGFYMVVGDDTACIGSTLIDGVFVRPPEPESEGSDDQEEPGQE